MNMLKNKKGFTLIEMLVVIAIIAVLVAIVIPVVGSSTTKASAAADAANLRSVLAEATTDYLAGVADETGFVKATVDGTGKVTLTANTENAPECKTFKGATLVVQANGGDIYVAFKTSDKYYNIKSFADVAENGNEIVEASAPAAGDAGEGVTPEKS